MFWSLSYNLMPDETVIEDSTKQVVSGFKATYSVFLTNKRVIFRFDGVGSSMAQSFFYHEILETIPVKRLLVNYLAVKTAKKQYYLHTPNPAYWTQKIAENRKKADAVPACAQPAANQPSRKKQELADMLTALQQYEILSAEEVEQKKRKLDTLRL